MKTPAIFIMGPTGCGKTDVAIHCAKHLPVDLISVDSALVYRGLDIGTAKPEPAILQRFPHALIDAVDPLEPYSAGRFRQDALVEMQATAAAGRLPLMVGGTGLYFRALEGGLAQLPHADRAVRQQIEGRAKSLGWAALHQELKEKDPKAAARIHPNDAQRIQRAMEVLLVSGKTMTQLQQRNQPTGSGFDYKAIKICLLPQDRQGLYSALEKRFKSMIKRGFLREVQGLYGRGDLSEDLPAMRSVGYRQLWRHLAGHSDFETACADAITATRRLAKRQMTWLRSDPDLIPVNAQDKDVADKVLKTIVTQLKALGHPCDTLPL